jgi:hypothetical protein
VFTVAWYAGRHEDRVAVWQGPFGRRVDAAFSHAESIRIFGSIGPEEEGLRRRIADAVG